MKYFAYGSNMSLARLQARVPSATRVGIYLLKEHDLRWHKQGKDGSAKCDAYFTQIGDDLVIGALFDIDRCEKGALDKAEGLGFGYAEKSVVVHSLSGGVVEAMTYCASRIDASLKPFSWYLHHVLTGAKESGLPETYVREIESVGSIQDNNKNRDLSERAIHTG